MDYQAYYQAWLKEYVKRALEPRYVEDVYRPKIYIGEKTAPVKLVIRRDRSQKLPPLY